MSIFKVGDRVFYHQKGWGEIKEIKTTYDHTYPIVVNFDYGGQIFFSIKGYFLDDDKYPSLSFTEYKFKGFSQVRPRPDIKAGDLIWVKDHGTDWLLKRFKSWTEKGVLVTHQIANDYSAPLMEFPIYSLECPVKS